VLFLYIVFEFVRLHGNKIPIVSFVTEFASRSRDENKFVLGPVTLVAGIILCAILYDSSARAVGIYALSFGDGLASLFGKLFGKKQIPFTNGKTIVGSVSCFVAVFVSSFCVCKNFFVSLVCAVVGVFVEILPLKDFDNLFIPVLIGGIAKFLLP
ncbi:MAG: phosphatidate cytidylyltransferase, partial [Treponema sp.]|nr:phosphatidate cytidylyltransferase [Treponema sp.]